MAEINKTQWVGSGATRRQLMIGAAVSFGAISLGSRQALAKLEDGISHEAAAIHQEVTFKASRKRVYELLTDTKQFDQVVRLSAAMQSMKGLGDKATEINREEGGAFTLFGGYITGRQIVLLPGERVVQAWRAGSWGPGQYSIAKFELVEQGPETMIVFDHHGFPDGEAQHLAKGWKGNYWEPMAKVLSL